jgi:hypothetical protein
MERIQESGDVGKPRQGGVPPSKTVEVALEAEAG